MLLVFQVDQLQGENTSLEQRIQGHKMRTQTMELELDKNSKKWKEKEISLLKEIDQLHIKVEEAMVIGQMGSSKQNRENPAHQDLKNGDLPDGATVLVNNLTTDLDDGIILQAGSLQTFRGRLI